MKQHQRNQRRAMRISLALASVKSYDGELDLKATIVDALSDLRHLCDKMDLSFAELDRRAHQHYLSELNLNNQSWLGGLSRGGL